MNTASSVSQEAITPPEVFNDGRQLDWSQTFLGDIDIQISSDVFMEAFEGEFRNFLSVENHEAKTWKLRRGVAPTRWASS